MSERQYFYGIKECPRCFGRLADTRDSSNAGYHIHCPNCGFNGPSRPDAPAALRAWNRDSNFRNVEGLRWGTENILLDAHTDSKTIEMLQLRNQLDPQAPDAVVI